MKEPVRMLDARKMAMRLFYVDIAALGMILLALAFLGVGLFNLGSAISWAVARGDSRVVENSVGEVFLIATAGALFALGFAWLTYRTLTQGYRNVTRVV